MREQACQRRESEALVPLVEEAQTTEMERASPTLKERFLAVRILDPEAGLVQVAETLDRKAGPLDHRRETGWEFLRHRRIVEG